MTKKRNPASRAASRAPKTFTAANASEPNKNAPSFQENWLRNRFSLNPLMAALVAEIVFVNAEAAR